MLNRRTLRIKIMQHIFAYRQSVAANYQIAKNNLSELFSLNLNSMEIQDAEKLSIQKKEALDLLKKIYEHGEKPGQEIDEEVIQAVEAEVAGIHQQNEKDKRAYKVNMVSDVDTLPCNYLSFIELWLTFHSIASNDQKRDHKNFVNNLLIKSILLNNNIQSAILECGKKWEGHPEARSWFKNLIATHEEYKEYLRLEDPTAEDDKAILLYLTKKVIFKEEAIDKFLEDKDLFWAENKPIIKSLLQKTFKSAEEENGSVVLQDISYNFEDDKTFFGRLFDETLNLDEKYSELVSKKAKNWDVDRLAITDKILLEMAIAEMIFFPSIPVKVTINEYIEVSKTYSTPKSKKFINGMLDVIANDLKSSGELRKSGRGLMDNK